MQVYQKHVNYTINGQHSGKLALIAEVVPISLILSTDVLEFSFMFSDLSPTISQEVIVSNPGNSEARFVWVHGSKINESGIADGPEKDNDISGVLPAFGVSPAQSTIPPGGSCSIRVTFSPQFGSPNQEALIVQVDGGKSSTLHCVGHILDPKCTLKDKKVEFGLLAAGIPQEKKIILQNTSQNALGIFYAEVEPAHRGVTVNPTTGCIAPLEQIELSLTLEINRPTILDNFFFIVKIRGGRTIKVPILAEIIIPEVKIVSPDSFVFGGVTLGVYNSKIVTLENSSSIPAHMRMDFTKYAPEFNVSMPADLSAKYDDIHSIFMPMAVDSDSTKVDSKTKSIYRNSNSQGIMDTELDTESINSEISCASWLAVVPANSAISFALGFKPEEIAFHEYVFPIHLEGLRQTEQLMKIISGQGLKPRLLLSTSHLNFENRVVARDSLRKVPYILQLILTNDDPSTVKWSIDITNLNVAGNRGVFHIAPHVSRLV